MGSSPAAAAPRRAACRAAPCPCTARRKPASGKPPSGSLACSAPRAGRASVSARGHGHGPITRRQRTRARGLVSSGGDGCPRGHGSGAVGAGQWARGEGRPRAQVVVEAIKPHRAVVGGERPLAHDERHIEQVLHGAHAVLEAARLAVVRADDAGPIPRLRYVSGRSGGDTGERDIWTEIGWRYGWGCESRYGEMHGDMGSYGGDGAPDRCACRAPCLHIPS